MKVTIIGGGNMGGAVARGLAKGSIVKTNDITVIDINHQLLSVLKNEYPEINTATTPQETVKDTDILIVAVKPWLVEPILADLGNSIDPERQIIISIAAGITFEQLHSFLGIDGKTMPLFRIIPNTAIAVGESLSLICHENASEEQINTVVELFNQMGATSVINENLMNAATSLTSCGIAYAFRYIRASMEGGVEMGISPAVAKKMVLQTLKGAVALLETNDSHPEEEIDKVTTPGGITIKGLNEMEHAGFTSAVIRGLKASKI